MDAISRQPEIAGKAVGFFLVGAAFGRSLRNLCFNYCIEIVRYDRLTDV